MKVTIPERVSGSKDHLFVLEVEFPVASESRKVTVDVEGPVEPLDLSGSGRGGTYTVPIGLERLHVPMRVLADGEAEATVTVRCTEGPDAPASETRTLALAPVASAAGSSRRWIALAAGLLVVAGGAWGLTRLLGSKGDEASPERAASPREGAQPPTAEIPEVRGLSEEEARARLEESGFTVRRTLEDPRTPEEAGRVLRVLPGEGDEVEIVVARQGVRLLPVPSVVGEFAQRAEDALGAAGFRVVTSVDEEAMDPANVGRVVRQDPPAGERLVRGAQVEIWVAGMGEPVTVPDLAGRPLAEAQAALEELGLTVLFEEIEVRDESQEGRVVEQEPAPEEALARGETVALRIGRLAAATPPSVPMEPTEPPPPPPLEPTEPPFSEPVEPPPVRPPPPEGTVEVPDVTGWVRAEAEEALRGARLVPVTTFQPPPRPDDAGRVLAQTPAGGDRARPGSIILLTVGDRTAEPLPPVEPPPVEPPPVEPPPVEPPPVEPPPVEPPPVEPPPVQPPPVEPPPVQPPVPPSAPQVERGTVPDVVGMPREKAEGLIRQAGLRYRIVLRVTDYPPDGTVLGQEPPPGGVLPAAGEVVLEVARTPPDARIPVPDVTGMERAVAEQMLRDAGFLVRVTEGGGSAAQQGRVAAQAPSGGSLSPRRSWVEIVVARGEGPTPVPTGGPPPMIGPPTAPSPAPSDSGGLSSPPVRGPRSVQVPPPTPRGPAPLPPVSLPPRDATPSVTVPGLVGAEARTAVGRALEAGLIPIIEVDRSGLRPVGEVVGQRPTAGAPALPGDLVHVKVSFGPYGAERHVVLPMVIGVALDRAQRTLASAWSTVEILELRVPGHPYAGTGRVAAQYPVDSVPRSEAARVTLWVLGR